MTTASLENAVAAHEQGSPHCAGPVELIADFARPPAIALPGGWRRRRGSGSAAAPEASPSGAGPGGVEP